MSKSAIVRVLRKIPDNKKIHTQKQQERWQEVRQYCSLLSDFFFSYFAGRELPESLLEENSKDYFLAHFDYLSSFYELIQRGGWKYIKDELPFNSPYKCFIQVLKNQADAQVYQCELGRFDVRPRQKNEMRRLAEKIKKGKAAQIQILNYENYVNSFINLGFGKFIDLEIACIKICNQNAKKDKRLKRYLDNYFELFNLFQQEQKRRDRKRRGYAWQNGERLETCKDGGTYHRDKNQ